METKATMEKVSVRRNLEKYYSSTMCTKCENEVCKVYGGNCKKRNVNRLVEKFNKRFGKK